MKDSMLIKQRQAIYDIKHLAVNYYTLNAIWIECVALGGGGGGGAIFSI